jgi:hypothetical protein
MPTPLVAREISIERKEVYEQALRKGFAPPGVAGGRGAVTAEVSRIMGVNRSTMKAWVGAQEREYDRGNESFLPNWSLWNRNWRTQVDEPYRLAGSTVPTGKRRTYLLTSAQNNTDCHDGFLENLVALARHKGAQIVVGRFKYHKGALGQRAQEVFGDEDNEIQEWYDPRIQDFVFDKRMVLADDLIWCGEMNILPTATRPLSGLENYAGGPRSGIFPHPKVTLESIATQKNAGTKFNYTTGAVTLPNYIQRKAGQKAQFHHILGALIVEVDDDGDWFVRQISADSDTGDFQDLDVKVVGGRVTEGHAIEAINWGDIHVAQLEDWQRQTCWGEGGIIDTLRPRYQFLHDTLDFTSRSHHDMKDPHEMFRKHVQKEESVEDELKKVVEFIHFSSRRFCQSVVVDSNHDNAYLRWLKEADWKKDPLNALFWFRSSLAALEAIDRKDSGFKLLEWALYYLGLETDTRFLSEDDSFVICARQGDGIECAMHGHLGPNGSRGSAIAFNKMGYRLNIGHSHSAMIYEGVFQAGVTAGMDHGYNKGPSSWSHSHIVTYASGKRSILTQRGVKYRG